MNRTDLQTLATLRLREARVLLDNGCFEGAYYLAGYAVECALKACIAKQSKRYDFPDRKFVNDSYSHDLLQLIRVANLATVYDLEVKSNMNFALHWSIVREWSEQARYRSSITQAEAENIYRAITVRRDGVLVWLKKYW